ncbi:MAG: hypothetical protein ABIN97_04980 [Ginsengibacter sp.]
MPDNSDDELLDNPIKTQSENFPDGIIPANDTEVINPKQETENMEVHHHPDIHHKPKKWKEYFLEFVMIFLAVTLGFIAENLREHFTDKAKEKQYIAGFIRNVQDDIANLRHVIEVDRQQVKGIDSMLKLSHVNMAIDSNRRSFYHLAIQHFYNSAYFRSNDATLQQLKSTGDYRLIEKDHVAGSLAKYDSDIHNDIYSQGDLYVAYFKEILSRFDELTDMTIFTDTSFIKGKIANNPLPPLRDDNGKLRTLFNKIFVFRVITNSYAENYLKPQLEKAKSLIAFLKKKYDIKD